MMTLPCYYIEEELHKLDVRAIRLDVFSKNPFALSALNKLTHPGEKRMVQYAKEQAEILPANFEENVNKLLENLFANSDIALQTLQEMIIELKNIIK